MLLRIYRMLAAFSVILLVGILAPQTAFAIDATVTNSSDVTEGGTGFFTIELDSAPASTVRVNYDIAGTAQDEVGEDDFTVLNGFVDFGAGVTSQTVQIITTDDNLSEIDETVILTLTTTDNASVVVASPNTATLTISDDDVPTVSVQAGNNISETSFPPVQFTFQTTNNVDGGLTINYSYSGTATYGATGDYFDASGTVNNSVTIAETDVDMAEEVTLTVVQDTIAEGMETVIVTIDSISFAGGTIDPDNTTASISLSSDDTVNATIASATQGNEDGTDATFVVSLSDTATTPIEIEYFDNASTADNTTDYTPPSGTITIPAGSLSGQINIPILNDSDNDAGETIVIDLNRVISGPAVITSPSSATNTIIDNDQALVSISAGVNGAEAATDNATFTISLDQPASATITVSVTSTGTASSLDYNLGSNTVTFATGEQTKTLSYEVIDDNIAEGTETIIATLSAVTGPVAIGTPNSATRLITDNDTATISVDSSPLDGSEPADTDTSFTIRTDTESSNDITVSFALGGTATEGSDYANVTKSVTIAAGSFTEDVQIDVLNDSAAEDNETVILSLSNVTAGSAVIGSDNSATLQIEDNDTVNISLGATVDTDEDNASADGTFAISAVSAAEADIVVAYSLGGTADNNTDYAGLSGQITIPRGSTNTTLAIDAVDDAIVEGDETVELTLVSIVSGPGVITGTPRTLTISDNDNATVSIAAVNDGAEPSTPGTFRVSSNSDAHSGIDISYSISGTVSAGDYSDSGSGSVTIPGGADNATFDITIIDDSLIEDNETLTVTLTAITSGDATIGVNDNASITITSDDNVTVTMAGDNASAENAGTGNLHINLDNASAIPITVSYSVSGTATSGTDFTALSGSVTVPANTTSQPIAISILDDSAYEDNETVIVSIDSLTGPATLGSPDNATLTITNDDNVTLSVAATTNANEDGTNGLFTFELTEDVAEDVIFTYSVVTGSSTASGSDYSITGSSPLTISAGDDNTTITVAATDDTLQENNETLMVRIDSITSGPAVIASTDNATMTIIDNDTLTVSLSSPDHGDETGPDNASVTLSLSGTATGGNIVVAYTVGGTATSGSDYTALSGSVTIDNGTSSKVLTIPVLDDSVDEDNETVVITLSSITSGTAQLSLTDLSQTVNIADNDNSSISITAPSTVDEGDNAVFTVTLSAAAGADTTLTYTDNGTATSGTDYTAPSGTLVIAAGNSEGTISIHTINDGIDDDNETLSITITAATGPVTLVGTPSATTTLIDVTDYEALLKKAAQATRKMIQEDLSISLDNARRTSRNIVRGAVGRLSDETTHDYTEQCQDDDSPKTDIDVKGTDRSVDGYGKYREVKRKCYSNEVTVASVDFSFADDGKGNETGTFSGVWASETTSDDLYSKYGSYWEVSVRNREQTKKDKGEIDTVRVNIGGYMVYRTAASSFLSSYITIGASQSSYDLTHDIVKSSGDFLAYNMGTGLGFTGEMRSDYLKFSPNISLDLFATGYQTFKGDFKIDGDIYKRDIEQSIIHKATFSFEPLMRIYSSKAFAEASSVTTIAPSIFCTGGSSETECGYSFLAENVTRNVLNTDFTTRLSYESIGDLTTTSLSLKANTHLFGNKFVRLANEVSASQETRTTSTSSASSSSSSSTQVTSDPYLSYKVYIEMLY